MIVPTNGNAVTHSDKTFDAAPASRTFQDSRQDGTKDGQGSYVVELEENCEDCGGSGFDIGSLSAVEPEGCRACRGSGKQIVRRNYLSEALRIAGGMSHKAPQREHLQAIIQHCRSLVAAAIVLPRLE